MSELQRVGLIIGKSAATTMAVLMLALLIRVLGVPHDPAFLGGYFASMICGVVAGGRIARSLPEKIASMLGSLLGLVAWATVFGLFVRIFIEDRGYTWWLLDSLGLKLALTICGVLIASILSLAAHRVYLIEQGRAKGVVTDRLPGSLFLEWAEIVVSAKTMTYIVRPLIADTQKEYLDALYAASQARCQGQDSRRAALKSTVIRLRWPLQMISALSLQTILSFAAAILRMVRVS